NQGLGAEDEPYSEHNATRARQARERGDVETLLSLLASAHRLDRFSAAANLGRINDPRALEALVQCLQSSDNGLRASALRGLGRVGGPTEADEVFEVASNDADVKIQITAMDALASMRDLRSHELIAGLLSRRDLPRPRRWYRRWAARRLVDLH